MRQASGLGDAAVILRRCHLMLHNVEHGSPSYRDERRIDRSTSLGKITSHTKSEGAWCNIDRFNGLQSG
jgi:hypothetical protein